MRPPLFHTIRDSLPALSVGITSAPLMRLGDQVAELEQSGAKLLHFDVADGRFCPLLTAGAFFVKGIKSALLKDVHLMVEDPLPFIPEFAAAGADSITVHAECGRHVHRALQLIGEQTNANDPTRGILRGIALLPGTPIDQVAPLLPVADLVCLVAINPGFPKQQFIAQTADRLAALRALSGRLPEQPLVSIDGGITAATIDRVALLLPDVVVSGSAVFENGRCAENFRRLDASLRRAP